MVLLSVLKQDLRERQVFEGRRDRQVHIIVLEGWQDERYALPVFEYLFFRWFLEPGSGVQTHGLVCWTFILHGDLGNHGIKVTEIIDKGQVFNVLNLAGDRLYWHARRLVRLPKWWKRRRRSGAKDGIDSVGLQVHGEADRARRHSSFNSTCQSTEHKVCEGRGSWSHNFGSLKVVDSLGQQEVVQWSQGCHLLQASGAEVELQQKESHVRLHRQKSGFAGRGGMYTDAGSPRRLLMCL